MSIIKGTLERVAAAVSFLTVLPVPGKKELAGSSAYFPLAGWILGGALWLAWTPMDPLPAFVRAFLIVAAWELASRGLHLDGLADTADAFLAGGGRERMLGIMGDSAIGAFGVMAVCLLLLGKFAVLANLEWSTGRDAVLCACVIGRYSLTFLACIFKPAKEEGLGSLIISTSGIVEFVVATVIAIAPLAVLFRIEVLYASAGLLPCLLLSLYARKKIGGLTGDILGACLEIAELAALFAFLRFY